MSVENFVIRTMARADIDYLVEWAAAEGWNPGVYDADSFFAADPTGYFVGELNGKPVAAVSAVRYGSDFGFMGFYIVDPEHRGKGYGRQIAAVGLEYLEGRNIGLDGVIEQQENYKRYGFKLVYRNLRYEHIATSTTQPNNDQIVELATRNFAEIEAYDREFFPADRSHFLRTWINQPEGVALAALDNDRLAGIGVIRKCHTGCKIGPLYADSADLAKALFLSLQCKVGSGLPIYLDVPEPNSAALQLAEHHKMKFVFETARMYTQKNPDIPLNRLYGVTSFELG